MMTDENMIFVYMCEWVNVSSVFWYWPTRIVPDKGL